MLSRSQSSSISCDVIRTSWASWMPSLTFFDGLGSRSSSLASKTGTPAWAFEEGDAVLAVLDDRAADLQRQLAAARRDDLGGLVGPGQERRHADLGDRGDRADGGLEGQLEVVLEDPAQLPGHLEPQGIHPDIGGLALGECGLHLRLEDLELAQRSP